MEYIVQDTDRGVWYRDLGSRSGFAHYHEKFEVDDGKAFFATISRCGCKRNSSHEMKKYADMLADQRVLPYEGAQCCCRCRQLVEKDAAVAAKRKEEGR